MKEIIQEGRNVEEAIDKACQTLGVEREAVEFEIIALPKRGFFGLINTPAKVRVYMEEPQEKQPASSKPQPSKEPAQERPKSRQEEKPQPQKQEQKPQKPAEPKPERPQKPKPEEKKPAEGEKPAQAASEATKKEPAKQEGKPQNFVPMDQVDGKALVAAQYLKGVLHEIGVDPEITVARNETSIVLRLAGEGLGVIIGRRGETLDSLQYLSSLVANREEGDYMRVTIDSGNYRQKRERTLEQLAQKLSNTAIRLGRPTTLEPMNPYERRIIHSTVSKIEGVTSASTGEEPNRRVVITPDVLKPQGGGRRRGRGGRGPRGEGEDRRDRKPRREHREGGQKREVVTPTSVDKAYMEELDKGPVLAQGQAQEPKPAPKPEQPPVRQQARKEGEDLPLYGKIEL